MFGIRIRTNGRRYSLYLNERNGPERSVSEVQLSASFNAPPPPRSQVSTLCVWNVFKLASSERAHFFQVRGMQAEQRRLGLVLSLLLPTSLIPAQWRGAAKDPALAFGTDVDADADDPLKDTEEGDMFVVGEERFA